MSARSIRSIETGRTARVRASTVRLLATAFELCGSDRDGFCAAAVGSEGTDLTPGDPATEPPTASPSRALTVAELRPCQLPPDLPDYTGNEDLVPAVGAALTVIDSSSEIIPPVVISGQGGVGKTALAVHVAHRVATDFPDGQLFISLRGTHPQGSTATGALVRALRGLGDDWPSTTDFDDLVDRYRARLAGRRMLVVLDDAPGAAHVYPFLPTGPGSAVLVTTRARLTTLAGGRHVELDLLDEGDAVTLLERIVGTDRIGPAQAETLTLVNQCARLPLALRVVGARLAARPHWTVGQLVERMSDERRRLDELAIDDLAVRAGLAVSYRGLTCEAQRALRALAYLDPPDFAAWTVAAMLEVDLTAAEDLVGQLLDTRLVEVVTLGGLDSRYRVHDLVRIYARELALATDTEDDLRAAVTRAVCLGLYQVERRSEQMPTAVPHLYRFSAPMFVDPVLTRLPDTEGAAWFDAEEPSLVAAVERAASLGLADLACALADALIFASFAVRNNFTGWNRAHRAALAVARSTGNVHAEAVIECGLGQLRYKEDRFTDAKQHFRRAQSLFRLQSDDRGETVVLNGLGTVCRERGEHGAALGFHRRAAVGLEHLGDLEGTAHAHYGIGFIHREQGNDFRAIEHLVRALQLYRSVRHVRGESLSLRGLGLVYRARGELDDAESYCTHAHDLMVQAGDRLLSGYTAQALAKVWIRQGRPERADRPLAAGLATCREGNDRLGIALIHRTIGEMHLAAGHPTPALTALAEAHRSWQTLDLGLWQARTLRDIGAACALAGDGQAAHEAWDRARVLFDRYSTRERAELSGWRERWGCHCAPEALASRPGAVS